MPDLYQDSRDQVVTILQSRLALEAPAGSEFVTQLLRVVTTEQLDAFLAARIRPPAIFLCAAWDPMANALFEMQFAIIGDQWDTDEESDDSARSYEIDFGHDMVWVYGPKAAVGKLLGLWRELMTGCGDNNQEGDADAAGDVAYDAVQALGEMLKSYPQ